MPLHQQPGKPQTQHLQHHRHIPICLPGPETRLARSKVLTPDYVRRFVIEFIPGARFITLPCGHEVPIEMPKETAWILQAFVAGLQEHAAEAGTA